MRLLLLLSVLVCWIGTFVSADEQGLALYSDRHHKKIDWKRDGALKIIFAKDCAFPSKVFQTFKSNVLECGVKCRGNPKCTHFAWQNNVCYLYSSSVKRDLAMVKKNFVCGFKEEIEMKKTIDDDEDRAGIEFKLDQALELWFASGCEFLRRTIKTVNTRQPGGCAKQCVELDECTHFNWFSGKCVLKEGEVTRKRALKKVGGVCGFKKDSEAPPPEDQETGSIDDLDDDNQVDVSDNVVKPIFKIDKALGIFFANGFEFIGNNIITVNTKVVGDCAKRCKVTRECTHFSWFNRKCQLKRGKVRKSSAVKKLASVCGFKEGTAVDVLEDDIFDDGDITDLDNEVDDFDMSDDEDRNGIEFRIDQALDLLFANGCEFLRRTIKTVNTRQPGGCAKQCVESDKCTHFNWFSGKCVLKEGEVNRERALKKVGGVCGFKRDSEARPSEDQDDLDDNQVDVSDDGDRTKKVDPFKIDPALQIWFANGYEFIGRQILSIKASVGECGKRCKRTKECTHFSWKSGRCSLKRGKVDRKSALAKHGSVCGFKKEHELIKKDQKNDVFGDISDLDDLGSVDTSDDIIGGKVLCLVGAVPRSNCLKYYVCRNGRSQIVNCPPRNYYNESQSKCVPEPRNKRDRKCFK